MFQQKEIGYILCLRMNLTGVRISSYYFKKITFLPRGLAYSLSEKESYRPANTVWQFQIRDSSFNMTRGDEDIET